MDFFRRLPDAGLREELIFRLLPATNSIKSRPRAAFFSFRIPASLIGLASTLPVARKLLVAHVVLACRDEQKISIRYGPQHFKTIAITSAKLFLNDRSQAVRLPKAFRFDGLTEVFIERDGDRVMLSPVRRPSIERLIGALDQFDASRTACSPACPISASRCNDHAAAMRFMFYTSLCIHAIKHRPRGAASLAHA